MGRREYKIKKGKSSRKDRIQPKEPQTRQVVHRVIRGLSSLDYPIYGRVIPFPSATRDIPSRIGQHNLPTNGGPKKMPIFEKSYDRFVLTHPIQRSFLTDSKFVHFLWNGVPTRTNPQSTSPPLSLQRWTSIRLDILYRLDSTPSSTLPIMQCGAIDSTLLLRFLPRLKNQFTVCYPFLMNQNQLKI